MIQPHTLKLETQRYTVLKERLEIAFGSLDETVLGDTLEGITNLHEMIAAVIRSALVDEAMCTGLRLRADEMRQRLTRLDQRSAKKRLLALEAMTDAGLAKLEQPDFTASARSGTPSLVVFSEEVIPPHYWIPQPPKLDRQGLLSALKRGEAVPGTQINNPKPVLTVRTK